MHRANLLAGEMLWAAGAKELFPVCMAHSRIRNQAEWRRYKRYEMKASDLLLTSYHPLGTCKMGRDPKTSVVDLNHQTHDLPGLFVVDGSTVPGPLGVNPQITIMAMATRAASRIDQVLSQRSVAA